MAAFEGGFEVQVAPKDVKMLANGLYRSCDEDDPDEEHLLHEAALMKGV